ncbi:hypothetical protein QQF64_000005 [Cirrhinus molitorella]|uniref:Uncharacterized protein n=1 Tax=Cirrhinus molitorella TaxID=172907 RepID=A0ABR3NWP2_9TELE
MLKQHFGDDHVVSAAYMEKVLQWPMIKGEDMTTLQDYAVFLQERLTRVSTSKPYQVVKHMGQGPISEKSNKSQTPYLSSTAQQMSSSDHTVHPKGQPDKALKVYAILDDQSNHSLARSEFFDLFNLKSTEFPYTLRTCAGVTEISGRQARDFVAHPLDGSLSVPLPTLIECNCMPEDRSEIPTPDAAKHHPHLKSIAHLILPLDRA